MTNTQAVPNKLLAVDSKKYRSPLTHAAYAVLMLSAKTHMNQVSKEVLCAPSLFLSKVMICGK